MGNMEKLIYHYFNDDDFLHISGKIKEMEGITSGEIRVAIKEKRSFLQRKKSLHQLAVEEFHKLKMNTHAIKPVFCFICYCAISSFYFSEIKVFMKKIGDATWDQVRDEIQKHFKDGISRKEFFGALNV